MEMEWKRDGSGMEVGWREKEREETIVPLSHCLGYGTMGQAGQWRNKHWLKPVKIIFAVILLEKTTLDRDISVFPSGIAHYIKYDESYLYNPYNPKHRTKR